MLAGVLEVLLGSPNQPISSCQFFIENAYSYVYKMLTLTFTIFVEQISVADPDLVIEMLQEIFCAP